jgi:uncharacterized membrane protein YqjE
MTSTLLPLLATVNFFAMGVVLRRLLVIWGVTPADLPRIAVAVVAVALFTLAVVATALGLARVGESLENVRSTTSR